MHMLVSLVLGLIGAFPYVFWELWCFVKPGLPLLKRGVIQNIVLTVSCLFMLGILFGYYIITPLVIHFLANYQVDPSIANTFDLVSYVSTIISLALSCACMFQLPIIVYFLARVGIVTPHSMRAYRKHAIVGILILAAIITPPDVMSQLLIAVSLMLLYEGSMLIAQFIANRERAP